MKKIDAHAHVGYFGGWANVGMTADEMVAAMDKHDIERTVISYMDNAVTEDAVKRHPDRYAGLIWVNPYHAETDLPLAERLIRDAGFKGIKLHPLFDAYTANDGVVHPVMELAGRLNVPVFIHSGHPPFSLPHSIAQLAQDFPTIPVVMVHMGHGNGIYVQAALDLSRKIDNLYLETSGMPMHTKIREAYETVGHDRIFWGTDAPFHLYEVEALRTQLCGLDDTALENIFYNNIKKFLAI
ncbi:MAG TPA: amidohydrolase [Candidatus Avidesulfovibrio excrementigallinarum]|nr:amidohydrolase [Candidatus Avidesulfovibrio excrementigallinarum]